MNITRSSQNLDTTKALSLQYVQWKHCSCGISIGNIVLVVVFQWKNYYCGITEGYRKCWLESCNEWPRERGDAERESYSKASTDGSKELEKKG